jgi:hypothetical protein
MNENDWKIWKCLTKGVAPVHHHYSKLSRDWQTRNTQQGKRSASFDLSGSRASNRAEKGPGANSPKMLVQT